VVAQTLPLSAVGLNAGMYEGTVKIVGADSETITQYMLGLAASGSMRPKGTSVGWCQWTFWYAFSWPTFGWFAGWFGLSDAELEG